LFIILKVFVYNFSNLIETRLHGDEGRQRGPVVWFWWTAATRRRLALFKVALATLQVLFPASEFFLATEHFFFGNHGRTFKF
jgi:antibiotic biosynthesis monooxygenase (ABM) superfamily enzyme